MILSRLIWISIDFRLNLRENKKVNGVCQFYLIHLPLKKYFTKEFCWNTANPNSVLASDWGRLFQPVSYPPLVRSRVFFDERLKGEIFRIQFFFFGFYHVTKIQVWTWVKGVKVGRVRSINNQYPTMLHRFWVWVKIWRWLFFYCRTSRIASTPSTIFVLGVRLAHVIAYCTMKLKKQWVFFPSISNLAS